MKLYGIVGSSVLYAVSDGQESQLSADAVPILQDRPSPDAILCADGAWRKQLEKHPPDVLDLNAISYAQADALIKATSVEELQASILDILGL